MFRKNIYIYQQNLFFFTKIPTESMYVYGLYKVYLKK